MKGYIAQLESGADALTAQNRTLQENLARYEADVPAMKDYIAQLEKDIWGLNDFAASKERYIQELQVEKEKLLAFLGEKDAYASELEGRLSGVEEQFVEEQSMVAGLKQELARSTAENSNLAQKYDSLLQAVEKIPFHKLWLKGIS